MTSLVAIGITIALAGAAFVIAQGTGEGDDSSDCVKTHGYWKNHASAWPVDSLDLGNQSYGEDELMSLLKAPPKGDASLILAHQFIAAELNIENGAEDDAVEGTLEDAHSLLQQYDDRLPLEVPASSDDGQQMVALAQTLDGYNNGRYGDACPPPPAEDEEGDDGNETDEDDEPEPTSCPKPEPQPNETQNDTEEVANPCPGDVRVKKDVDQTEFKVAFNLSVESLGPNKARQVVLNDSLPDLGHEWRLKGEDAEDCTLTGLELRCDFGNLSLGESRSVRVWSPYCPEECGEDIVNTAYVTAANDANATNNQASATVDVPDCPEPEQDGDASLGKQAEATLGNGTGDDEVVFDLTVESLGPATVTNVTLHDELPDLGGSYNVTGEAADDCTLDGRNLTCDLGDIAAGESRSLSVVSGDSELGCGDDVVNTAHVTAANDADASNDEASATLERDDCPPETADVSVAKSVEVTEGVDEHKDTVQFLLRVDSLGPADAANVTLVDELPDFGSNYTLGGADADDCSLEGFLLTCEFGTVAAGENRSVDVTSYLCEIGCGDDVVNTATVSADDDADASNDEASATVERDDCPEADVGVTKSATVIDRTEDMKDTVEFTVVVSSLGTADATNVTLVDELPALDDHDHAWAMSGDGAEDCTLEGLLVTCDFGTLAPGANRTLVLSAYQCEIGCGGDIVNTATVSADEDSDASNNEATAVVERDDCPPAEETSTSSSTSDSSSSTSDAP